MSRMEASFARDGASICGNVNNLSTVLVGDFNIQLRDEPKIKVDAPGVPGTFRRVDPPFAVR